MVTLESRKVWIGEGPLSVFIGDHFWFQTNQPDRTQDTRKWVAWDLPNRSNRRVKQGGEM
jgi:hypothetical protein